MGLYKPSREGTEDGIWSDTHQGFPWYMDEEAQADQSRTLGDMLKAASWRMHFTPDYPKLMKQTEHYIFVYGTLKRGKKNHKVIERAGSFLAEGYTADKTFLLRETAGRIPVVTGTIGDQDQSAAARISGEIYMVSTETLANLDEFEQNGVLYRRAKLCIDASGQRVIAWTYLGIKTAWGTADNLTLCPKHTSKKDRAFSYYCYAGVPLTQKKKD